MALALPVPPPSVRKRVKVYELRDNDWFDRGTGFCTGQIVNVSSAVSSLPTPARLRRRPTAGRFCGRAVLYRRPLHGPADTDAFRNLG